VEQKKKPCILGLPLEFTRKNVRFYSFEYLFSSGFKFTIGFVCLHVSLTYSMVDLKIICREIIDKWLGE
jgi:hypothetical protein